MKLKLDEDGNAVLEDGKPVYVSDDGEAPVDVAAMQTALTKANAEAAKRRTAHQEATAKLKLFGDLDPKVAREALAFREALGDDVDPEKVTTEIASLKAERAGLTTQVEDLQGKWAQASEKIDELTLGAQISSSKFIGSKVNPALRDPDLFRAAYGKHLGRDEDGNVVVKDAAGNTIMSEKNAGEPASLDEALPKIVTRETHLAAGNASGGGESGAESANGQKPGAKKWSELGREAQIAAIREHESLAEAQKAYA